MKMTDSLSLSEKGHDELINRTYKLNMQQRGVLILLKTPCIYESFLQKPLVNNSNDFIVILEGLAVEGFIAINANGSARETGTISEPDLQLQEGIVVSEAKFQLINYCVDNFGTKSQELVTQISECTNEKQLQHCLNDIVTATKKEIPDQLKYLFQITKEINKTA